MKKLFTMFMLAAFTFAVVACDNKSEKEEASEQIEESTEAIGEEIEEATEEIGDAIEKSAQETKDAINAEADTIMDESEEVIEE